MMASDMKGVVFMKEIKRLLHTHCISFSNKHEIIKFLNGIIW